MKLEKASGKAITFACKNFHYAKRIPYASFGYSVFNNKKEWCGVVLFNRGNIRCGAPYKLLNGQIVELIRVALNGKQESTTKAVAIALRLLKKDAPNVKMVVSYADIDQDHIGVIYQAGNWIYEDTKKTRPKHFDKKTGKEVHDRQVCVSGVTNIGGKQKKCYKYSDVITQKRGMLIKYVYPLSKEIRAELIKRAKPYPKKQNAVIA